MRHRPEAAVKSQQCQSEQSCDDDESDFSRFEPSTQRTLCRAGKRLPDYRKCPTNQELRHEDVDGEPAKEELKGKLIRVSMTSD
jgi:hypothetical protein